MSDGPHGIDPLLTAAEVSQIFKVSKSKIYAHANGRRCPHIQTVKLGGSVRFRQSTIEQLIEELERGA